MDVVSASHLDIPSSVDGKPLGFKHCLVFVDAFSGHIRVYFAKKQDEVPTLTRFYLQELGTTLMFGSTFMKDLKSAFDSVANRHGLFAVTVAALGSSMYAAISPK